VATTGQ